jgi:hypothetical protein
MRHKLAWGAWLITSALGLFCAGIFAAGVLRDTRAGEPSLRIDLSAPGGWSSTPFRVWGKGDYLLFLSIVNHDRGSVGARYAGEIEALVEAPGGKVVLQRIYAGDAAAPALPLNYGDRRLGAATLDHWPLRQWMLRARVLKGDPSFGTARSQIKFWKDRPELGMGGMMNYVMILPAGIFLLLALAIALWLAGKKSVVPVWLTAGSGAVLLSLLLLR